MTKKFAIKINKISKAFEEKEVLLDISFSLYFGQKVAIIGANGSGKSTLAKIIIGKEKQDSGNIEIFPSFSISYLPQEADENILVQEYLEKNSRTFSILNSFGFTEEIFRRKISSLSGGEKTKIFLTKISIENSQIIILDEPTNNLDTDGLKYLEDIIKNSKSAFLIISHHRSFLDKTVSKIIFLDPNNHNIKSYDGNYSDFLEIKKQEESRQDTLFSENQRRKNKIEGEINSLQSRASVNKKVSFSNDNDKYIDFNKTARNLKKNSKKLKATKVKLENFQEKEKVITKRPLKIDFSEMKNSGNNVLKISDLLLPFGSKSLRGEKISLEIFSGDRLHITGKNGAGKSTFLKEILKNLKENNKNIS
jgi:ATPase subunit of ABC transporter with duplicated ATPase domains